jgi:hypothetical protein
MVVPFDSHRRDQIDLLVDVLDHFLAVHYLGHLAREQLRGLNTRSKTLEVLLKRNFKSEIGTARDGQLGIIDLRFEALAYILTTAVDDSSRDQQL